MAALINSFSPTRADIVGGQFNVLPPVLTDSQFAAFQIDAAGNLKVTFTGGSASNQAASPTGSAVPASASYTGVNVGGILQGITGFSLTNSLPAAVAIVDGSGNQITSFGGGTQYASGATVATPTGTQIIAWDGTKVWAISAAHLTNANALAVEIVDGSGNQITSFGGGIQFADNAASGATPTGTLSMGWDSANSKIRALKVDASQNLFVNVANTVAITGTVVVSGTVAVTESGTWNVNQAIGVAGFEKITDGTNIAAVKAANTAPVAADPALVIAISPNSVVYLAQAGVGPVQWNAFHLTNKNAAAVAIVDGTGNQITTFPISGNVGVTGTVAVTESGTWNVNQAIGVAGFEKITDGTNTAAVKAASTAAVAADPSLVVALSPNSPLPAGTNVIGHVVVDSGSITVSGSVSVSNFPSTVDVTDRAARLLGIVYGSQSQQLKQTATNFNLQVELATGGTLYDARQIRALTSADVVTAAQGTAAALAGYWPVRVTDGTNTMPTGDAAARTIHVTADNATLAVTQSTSPWVVSGTVTANQGTANTLANKWPVQVTDGTNVMPTGDAIARAQYHVITDGTNGPVAVKAASTRSVAVDPSLVVALSPNSPVAMQLSGGGVGPVTGTALTNLNALAVMVVDGNGNQTGIASSPLPVSASFADPAEGVVNTSTQPASAIQVAGWDGSNLRPISVQSDWLANQLETRNRKLEQALQDRDEAVIRELRAIRYGMGKLVGECLEPDAADVTIM